MRGSETIYNIQKLNERKEEENTTALPSTLQEEDCPELNNCSVDIGNCTGLKKYQTAGQIIQCGSCPHHLGLRSRAGWNILFMYCLAVCAHLILHGIF